MGLNTNQRCELMADDPEEIKNILTGLSAKQKGMVADLLEDALEGGMYLDYSEITDCIEWLRDQA